MDLYIVFAVAAGIVAGLAVYFGVAWLAKRRIADSLRMSLMLVKIPISSAGDKSEHAESKDLKAELAHFEQLFSGLSALKKLFVFEVAVPHVGEEIHFYLSVPKLAAETAAKQIQGLWNGASVERVEDDFNIFNVHGASVAAYVKQKENFALPIRTYNELGIDSFESIVGAFAKIDEVGEGAALQVVIRPASDEPKTKVRGFITALKKGEPFEKVVGHESPFSLSEVGHALNPEKAEKEKKERVADEEAVKALEAKIAKPLFLVNVRLVASAGSKFQADDILSGLTAGFSQFGSPRRNEFKIVKPRNPDKLIRQFIFREYDSSEAMILSSEEIASFYHLPISSTETPRVKWLKSKEAAPPANLPTSGILIGESVFRGQTKPVYITDDDRRRHVYVVGQTGTGKSTLLGNMFIEDLKSGKGLAVIDPHGDLVQNALGFIPKERLDDLIYFDPGDLQRPLGLNMLDYNFDRPEEKTFIVNE
ncbi:MAG: DUF87 domain-containing protein, partial [Candidatus Liptonbacteria bacterium]|nr:DUF87 domain-containing protein [Candidatus Liptonbacteria bacterium]